MSENVLRAAAYIRLSKYRTEDEARSLSPEAQLASCRETCRRHGFELAVIEEDLDESAWQQPWRKRAGFVRLVELANCGKIDALVVSRMDRFARRAADTLEVADMLRESGAALASSEYLFDNSSTGKLLLGLLAMLAEVESSRISERVRGAAEFRARSGRAHGGTPPAWVRRDPEAGVLTLDEDVAATFRILAELRAEGMGSNGICTRLNAAYNFKQSGKPWTVYEVRRYFSDDWVDTMAYGTQWYHRPSYRKTRHGKKLLRNAPIPRPGTYPPLWQDEEQARTMAAKMKAANARQKPQGGKRVEPNNTYLLTGLLRCGGCGGRMKPNRSGGRPLYKCVNNGHPSHGNGATNITAEHVEEAVIRVFGSPLLAPLKQTTPPSKATLERKIRAIDDRKRRAYDAYEAGLQSLEEYRERAYELDREIAEARNQQLAAQAGPPPPVDPSLPRDVLRDRIRQWVARAVYPIYHTDVRATRGGFRPMVRLEVDEGETVEAYYAPIYRTGFTGKREVFTETMLLPLPADIGGPGSIEAFEPWFPPEV